MKDERKMDVCSKNIEELITDIDKDNEANITQCKDKFNEAIVI